MILPSSTFLTQIQHGLGINTHLHALHTTIQTSQSTTTEKLPQIQHPPIPNPTRTRSASCSSKYHQQPIRLGVTHQKVTLPPFTSYTQTDLRFRFASNIVQQIAFGVKLTEDEDLRVQHATSLANRVLAEGGLPGSTVIDNFPFLAKLPSWLVRSDALKHARGWGWVIRDLHDIPFAASRSEFVSPPPSTSLEKYTLMQNRKLDA